MCLLLLAIVSKRYTISANQSKYRVCNCLFFSCRLFNFLSIEDIRTSVFKQLKILLLLELNNDFYSHKRYSSTKSGYKNLTIQRFENPFGLKKKHFARASCAHHSLILLLVLDHLSENFIFSFMIVADLRIWVYDIAFASHSF